MLGSDVIASGKSSIGPLRVIRAAVAFTLRHTGEHI
jgi:hypothetical protein